MTGAAHHDAVLYVCVVCTGVSWGILYIHTKYVDISLDIYVCVLLQEVRGVFFILAVGIVTALIFLGYQVRKFKSER